MKLALAQINPKVGDLENNAKKILDCIHKSEEADLIVFPELSLCGYPPKDLLFNKKFIDDCWEILEKTIAPQITKATLIGLPTKNHMGTVPCQGDLGVKIYNSAALIQSKKVQKIIHKKLLPNYEVFFEARYFQAGEMNTVGDFVIEVDNKKIAVLICEDLLAVDNEKNSYSQTPISFLKNKVELDLAICLSASPFRKNHNESRIKHGISASKQLNCPVVLVNQVGANDDLIFDGHSFLTSQKGEFAAQAKGFKEDLTIVPLTPSQTSGDRGTVALPPMDEQKKALILGIKDYFEKTGFKKAFIGISGGIDSALVACLAQKALGKQNVLGILMPSKYSSTGSIKDSEELLNNLGAKHQEISIQPILESTLKQTGIKELTQAEENLQARIRGNILMALSNQQNALVLATGNKSEFAVGYSTLYGDSCGALAPIGDLWKTEVWELAKTFPEIPKQIIEKPPSAELRPEQLDTDSLPDYKILDQILKFLIESGLSQNSIVQKGFDEEMVNKIFKLVSQNEFKRRQVPIILKVSNTAFGGGWVYPVVKG